MDAYKKTEINGISTASANDGSEFDIFTRMLPMRDGVKLCTRFYMPRDCKKGDAIMVRCPYHRTDKIEPQNRSSLAAGWIVVDQDCRGTGCSEGEFDPWYNHEGEDAEDTVAFLRLQPWFSGKLALDGGSYCAHTQMQLVVRGIPEIVSFKPSVSPSSIYKSVYRNGAFALYLYMEWGLSMYCLSHGNYDNVPNWIAKGIHKVLPLTAMDEKGGVGRVPFFQDWLAHPEPDEYWKKTGLDGRYCRILAPAYFYSGWFDIFTPSTIENFQKIHTQGGSEKARNYTRFVIGPWVHGGLVNPELFGADNTPEKIFNGPAFEFTRNCFRNPDADPLPSEPRVKYFMMGCNEWRGSGDWPPPEAVRTEFFLHSRGCANSRFGNGLLDLLPPGEETPDVFVADPENPVLSEGGLPPTPGRHGCVDHSRSEERTDLLVYTSKVLAEPLEIAGKIEVGLWAESSATDTDFTVKLLDVQPDGRALNLCCGILRARYRNGVAKAELLTPGEPTFFEIDGGHTANRFASGHRIRLEIAGSDFPEFDRNPQTGHGFASDAETVPARQTVFHDARRISVLRLPVVNQK